MLTSNLSGSSTASTHAHITSITAISAKILRQFPTISQFLHSKHIVLSALAFVRPMVATKNAYRLCVGYATQWHCGNKMEVIPPQTKQKCVQFHLTILPPGRLRLYLYFTIKRPIYYHSAERPMLSPM